MVSEELLNITKPTRHTKVTFTSYRKWPSRDRVWWYVNPFRTNDFLKPRYTVCPSLRCPFPARLFIFSDIATNGIFTVAFHTCSNVDALQTKTHLGQQLCQSLLIWPVKMHWSNDKNSMHLALSELIIYNKKVNTALICCILKAN